MQKKNSHTCKQSKGKFLLIADPEMTHNQHWIHRYISERYTRRNYQHLIHRIQPTDIFVFGDPNIPHTYTTNNGSFTFSKYNYAFVVLDTTQDIQSVLEKARTIKLPKILMTHMPLYRPDYQTCGPYRQSGSHIDRTLSQELTDTILNTVQPIAVFSGADLDYCKIIHQFGDSHTAVEITVPTFSMRLQYPGVMVLNINPKVTTTTDLCWLPDQYGMFVHYGYAVVFSMVVLCVWHWYSYKTTIFYDEEKGAQPVSHRRRAMSLIHSITQVGWVSLVTWILFSVLL